MPSQAARIDRQARAAIAEGYDNFSDGMERLFGTRPNDYPACEPQIRQSFAATYSLLEWCRAIRRIGNAGEFLREIRSSMPIAISLAGLGVYDASRLQLRYAVECLLAFLYFRDHPRERELATADSDIWELTRPRAVLSFLRKLPEFRCAIGADLLNSLDMLYQDLCRYSHPRSPSRMSLRQYLSSTRPSREAAEQFCSMVRAFAKNGCGVLRLCSETEFVKAAEVTQNILVRCIPADWRRRIDREMTRRAAGS